jgi:hypothetical protein
VDYRKAKELDIRMHHLEGEELEKFLAKRAEDDLKDNLDTVTFETLYSFFPEILENAEDKKL